MLTPRFELSQTEECVILTVHAPYARVSDTEVCFEDNIIWFHSKPYYLRLHLPGRVEENEQSVAKYDSDSGKFIIHASKVQYGENFEGLDMLTSLLAPKGVSSVMKPGIEIIGTEPKETSGEEEEYDWFIEQEIPSTDELTSSGSKYGFANQKGGVFLELRDELHEVVDVKDPDKKKHQQRRQERQVQEELDFISDHYLADYFETEATQPALKYETVWEKLHCIPGSSTETCNNDLIEFTQAEKDKMLTFPNSEFFLEPPDLQAVYLNLVDILYAYAYDHRTTDGEHTSESAWTIAKLSATLSWLDSFVSLPDVVTSCLRRSLCYPLYRNWKLSLRVLKDTYHILLLGRKQVLKILLDIHGLFNGSECRYLLNQLYIQDYCVWIQQASENRLQSLAEAIVQLKPCKDDVGLELLELEQAALLVQEEERCKVVSNPSVECLTDQVSQLALCEPASATSELKKPFEGKEAFDLDTEKKGSSITGVKHCRGEPDGQSSSSSWSDTESSEDANSSSDFVTDSDDCTTDSDESSTDSDDSTSGSNDEVSINDTDRRGG